MNLKKMIIGGATAGISMALLATTVFAAPAGKDTPANDNPQNLYLYSKDASWGVVWDEAWGKYNYSLAGTTISGSFNGHGLVPGTDYTLVEYNGWPSVTVIGNDVADAAGNVHIAGTADVGTGGEVSGVYKIWLVLSSDVSGGNLTGWNPSAYLFEHNLIP
ncbi:hypothetical protein A2872_02710 [Candidatus Gottesmanbacteria bacterium RIFCSPHIGHO2_01_FULL_42_12]|uniref:Uncharacterized protein n=1 Tax=Candidatus Gottesmanbacteria bacterium RIFCSPHIGHO2_01_FULL_42_12 TaxID=1798377 RepID=A0A1F5Z3Z8_9BACT|nr:MAG: hypothetical protein A2872_02710 [Candidatus Gottesmanbacteria bacterium RIFCSPHIGHO2_01_FULL_42_12]